MRLVVFDGDPGATFRVGAGGLEVRAAFGYAVLDDGGRLSIVCFACGRRSYHPRDVEHKYCGHCRAYLED